MTPTTTLSNWSSMILPVVVIAAIAVLLPLWLAGRLPQSMLGLGVNLVMSVGVLLGVSIAYFAAFRPPQVMLMITEGGEYFSYAVWDLLRVGLLSAMIWGPIVLVVLAMQPSKWRPEV